jgi:geranylgeranyl diphosphate synthase type I
MCRAVGEGQLVKVPVVFEKYRAEIDGEMRAVMSEHQLPMYDMMRYHLGWVNEHGHSLQSSKGKALRPTLCLLACEATGNDFRKALPAAASVELVHNFSLIHDDIQDNDRERRHCPTVWSIWGKPQAINAGTAMCLLGSITLLSLGECNVPVPKQLRAQRLLDESCLRLIEGQYLDIDYETRLDVVVTDYLEMIDKKTGALIGCSLELGALLGTDDESFVERFRNFGRNLGLAFQIRDDILGIWGNGEKTGKPLGSDIQHKKKSLPIVYALEKAGYKAKTELLNVYQSEAIDDSGLDKILMILDGVRAKVRAQSMAEEYRDRALMEIEKTVLSPWAQHSLEEMAHFLVERDF